MGEVFREQTKVKSGHFCLNGDPYIWQGDANDIKKLRNRVKDALCKCSINNLFKAAELLNVKI